MSDTNETDSSKPGRTGESLDDNDNVIRLGLEQSNYDAVAPNHFRLNSTEKKQEWKRISVWETSLTTVAQARSMLSNPKRKLVIRLNVGEIRSIDLDKEVNLDVKWDRLETCIDTNGQTQPSYQDGCEGHCALDGVYPSGKKRRKKLRKKLAELATSSEYEVIDN